MYILEGYNTESRRVEYLKFVRPTSSSEALRHSNVAVTAAHYLTKRPRVTVGFGALVTPENVVAMPDFNERTNELRVSGNNR
jgi:hypothetical protein